MISAYAFWLIIHLLLFAYWLGGDLGVFYSSFVVADADRSVDDRKTAAGILIGLDRVPRICLILMLPVGVSLAASIGQVVLPAGALLGIWLLAAVWLAMLWHIEKTHHAATTKVDAVVRIIVILALAGFAVAGLSDSGPVKSDWVAIKMLLFATAITCGLMIRKVFAPFGAAFGQLVTQGSSPEVEQTIDGSLKKSRPFVIVIWLCLIAAAAVAAIKPAL
ncbi:MAG: hypothetical protein AAGJ86_09830 [Pseudomonadota bacterium]